jgi:two-component system sensor histidine kinase BarA
MVRDDEFRAMKDSNPNFGMSEQALWLRVNIDNLTDNTEFVVSITFAQLDFVDFYIVHDDAVQAQSQQGKLQSGQRFRLPAFAFSSPVGESVSLFIRVQSDSSSLIVPTSLQSAESFALSTQIDSIAWGLFYGGLFILAIFNFALFIKVKQLSLIAYITYISAVLIWHFIWGGHVHLLFLNGQPTAFASHTEVIFMLVGVSAGLFTASFLEVSRYAPRMAYAVYVFILTQLVVGAVSALDLLSSGAKNTLVYGVASSAILIYIAAGFEAFFNHLRSAIYFIFAWTILCLGALGGLLSLVGVLPSNNFTIYCFQVAVFLEAGLFSFALMEKTQNQLQNEIEQATTDLRNNMEVIEEQNARLDIARKNAIKASNIKSQFLANMSHEIRTPLNAILGFGKELERANLAFTENEQVKIVNSAAENLLTIVNDVLDFSKIEAGKLQVNNSPFSPLSVFEEMVAIMSKTAHSKGLDFIFDSSPLPDKLISDEIRLKQVLTNLIGNALKFTSKGSVTLSVSAQHRQHGVIDLFFDVKDTGIGISRADRKKLFSAFSQVDDAINRSFQGTGLGLVISQELVRLMNGSIDLRSQPGQGSTFSVMVRASHINQRSSFSYPNKVTDLHVVVFDPLPDSRRATSKMLKALGAQVTSVDSLEYLQTLDQEFDFLMVFLPNQSRYSEATVLHCALTINAKTRIVWYCKQDPLQTRPIFKQGFNTSLSMPATPSRLARLVAIDAMPVLKRPLQKPVQSYRSQNNVHLPEINILAVDDMAMNLSLLDTWLKSTDVTLVKAFSAEEAINHCKQTEFDLILMDVQMPVMDGLEATKIIRKIDKNMGTPIIAVTAHAFKEEQERLLSNGMDDYLPKPLAYDALMKMIKRWHNEPESSANQSQTAVCWNLAMNRSNQDEQISQQMMKEFLDFLPSAQKAISRAEKDANYTVLTQEIHKLHGASCYTGAPVIQSLSKRLEIHLKLNEHQQALDLLPSLYNAMIEFEEECVDVLYS